MCTNFPIYPGSWHKGWTKGAGMYCFYRPFLAIIKKSQLESTYQHSAVQGAQKIEWSKREEAAFVAAAAGAVTRVIEIETEVRQLRGVFF